VLKHELVQIILVDCHEAVTTDYGELVFGDQVLKRTLGVPDVLCRLLNGQVALGHGWAENPSKAVYHDGRNLVSEFGFEGLGEHLGADGVGIRQWVLFKRL
jgi:hypothetical protein